MSLPLNWNMSDRNELCSVLSCPYKRVIVYITTHISSKRCLLSILSHSCQFECLFGYHHEFVSNSVLQCLHVTVVVLLRSLLPSQHLQGSTVYGESIA